MNNEFKEKKKTHRSRLSGRKAEKKKAKNKHVQELTDEQRNPKAFAVNSVIRAERKFRRTQDLRSKKEHIPVVDRTPVEPPPILVAVVGPPKVGKSSLIKCLIKSYTRQPLSSIKGPVTLVSGKKRRITFIECNNDVNSMVDLAKVADLVLLLIDASFGFEMEIFEFLNICQVHGMPRIMGVLTHLDMIKQTKKLQRTKKTLKKRFWTEVYAGAKLFYLSGLLHNEYLRNEIKNLARFISVMKFRPLTWQTTHSYMLADRLEDITPPERIRLDPKVDRRVCLYGYMRGIPMNKNSFIHIPGCGDFPLSDICFLPDPCPLPEQLKKRSLIDKERLVYAPFSGVGGIVYDKDAVYVELPRHSDTKENEIKEMVDTLIESKETLDTKLAKSTLQLFSNSKPFINEDFDMKSGKVKKVNKNFKIEDVESEDGRNRRKVIFDEEESERGDFEDCKPDKSEKDVISEEEYDENEEEENSNTNKKKPSKINFKVSEEKNSKMSQDSSFHVEESDESSDEEVITDSESESDYESDSNFQEKKRKKSSNKIQPLKKKKDTNSENSDKSFDSSFTLESVEGEMKKTKKALLQIANERKESARYTGVQSEKDREVKNIISSVLADLEVGSSVPERCDTDSQDSSDEEIETKNLTIDSVPWEKNVISSDVEESDDDNEQDNDEDMMSDSEDDDNLPENTDSKWKENLAQKAANEFLERQANTKNLWKLVYGDQVSPEVNVTEQDGNEEELGGLFRVVSKREENKLTAKDRMDAVDCSKFKTECVRDWALPEHQETIKDCFITGKWKMEEDANELLKLDDLSEDEEVFGDFEDLETGKKFKAEDLKNKEESEKLQDDTEREKLMEKKKKLKEKFDMEYDNIDTEVTYFDELKNEANKQAELNRNQFEGLDDKLRVELEGFRAGMYVRLEIADAPCELIDYFDPSFPVIAGGLQTQEHNIGYVKARIKKHRWYNRILKTRDPLIISVGWRRFQTIAVYSKQEDNMRHRMLKYTPEHLACMSHFWGPLLKAGTGFLALKNAGSKQVEPGFRIVATGTVIDTNQSTVVTKKLKLTGEPYKIYKKTAFIKGMFNTTLEVAKFEGARIKTVSGIRGQIKKVINSPEGAFRATFEDKILLSDIVFCRTWYRVDIPQFYAPVTTLLLPPDERNTWQGMKTVGQLKRDQGIQNPAQPDSMYKKIVRPKRKLAPLVVPRAVERELPFKYKRKDAARFERKGVPYQKKVNKIVIRDEHESKVSSMMEKLRAAFMQKEAKKKKVKRAKLLTLIEQKKSEQLKKDKKHKEIKKNIFRILSKTSKKNNNTPV